MAPTVSLKIVQLGNGVLNTVLIIQSYLKHDDFNFRIELNKIHISHFLSRILALIHAHLKTVRWMQMPEKLDTGSVSPSPAHTRITPAGCTIP